MAIKMDDQSEILKIVEFQVTRNIINLYKSFLILIEDVEHEHCAHFKKLKRSLPEDIDLLEQADYLTEEKMDLIRKRILDSGNHCIREIMTMMQNMKLN